MLANSKISHPLNKFSAPLLQTQFYFLRTCYFIILQRYLISSIFKRPYNSLVSKLLQRNKVKERRSNTRLLPAIWRGLTNYTDWWYLSPELNHLKTMSIHMQSLGSCWWQELHKEMLKYRRGNILDINFLYPTNPCSFTININYRRWVGIYWGTL